MVGRPGRRHRPPYDVIDDDALAGAGVTPPPQRRTADPPARRARGRRLRAGRRAPCAPGSAAGRARRGAGTGALRLRAAHAPPRCSAGWSGRSRCAHPREGVILPHEDVMPGPVTDRLELMRATAANLEPILLAVDGGAATDAVVAAGGAGRPAGGHRASTRWRHRVWRCRRPGRCATGSPPTWPAATGADRRRAPPLCHLPAAAGRASRRRCRTRSVGPRAGAARGHLALPAAGGGDPPGGRRPRRRHRRRDGRAARCVHRGCRATWPRALRRAARDAASRQRVCSRSTITTMVLLTDPDPAVLDAVHAAGELDRVAAHRRSGGCTTCCIDGLGALGDEPRRISYHHDLTRRCARSAAVRGLALLLNPVPVDEVHRWRRGASGCRASRRRFARSR